MKRTQIQLTDVQAETLARLAKLKKLSIAEIIRQGVELYLRMLGARSLEDMKERAISAAGRFKSGTKDLSTKHDEYLTEAFKK